MTTRRVLALWVWLLASATVFGQSTEPIWLELDYADLIDGRQPTHSGDSVEDLLARLEGRPIPAPGTASADRLAHSLIEPWLEPYAFVLADALSTLSPADPPFREMADFWPRGAVQPAWVELLRARRLLVETDGNGRLRIVLPVELSETAGPSGAAAESAWHAHRPILRHVIETERKRLGKQGIGIEVYAYHHESAQGRFRLGRTPFTQVVADTSSLGTRPPLDLKAWERFLEKGLQLEGARLEPDGSIVLLGSPANPAATLLGRPLSLSDFAAAYRAVFHGGLSEPYMSLDRGHSPQRATVNYGGRLRDTSLGWVSLLCDIRFKTFSLGLDIVSGEDLRATVRKTIPDFRSHLERFAADPASQEVAGQQTRLWFYPDRVDLTVSGENDVVVLRRVRMSAASERVASRDSSQADQDPPWTRQTVQAIDDHYDGLARYFPEMQDLDQVVRLLSLFTWARQAEAGGRLLPDLDVLLTVELPELPTPAEFPQMLAFNALGAAGSGKVDVFDRVPVAEALDRLHAVGQSQLPAEVRLARAVGALDRRNPQNARLIDEIGGYDLGAFSPSALDRLTYRAERLRMHQTVLSTLPAGPRSTLGARQASGEKLRLFSVGIGGLDLGMDQVLQRARGDSMRLTGLGGASVRSATAPAMAQVGAGSGTPQQDWRVAAIPSTVPAGTPAYRSPIRGRALSYDWNRKGSRWSAKLRSSEPVPLWNLSAIEALPLPDGLALLRVGRPLEESGVDPNQALRVRLDGTVVGEPQSLEANFPRELLQRLVLGPDADPAPGQPLPGFSPLPPSIGEVEILMLLGQESRWVSPEVGPSASLAGEEDPLQLGRALNRWWTEVDSSDRRAVVGVRGAAAIDRWRNSSVQGEAVLWTSGPLGDPADPALAVQLRRAWPPSSTIDAGRASEDDGLVAIVSWESPELFEERLRRRVTAGDLKNKLVVLVPLGGALPPHALRDLLETGELGALGVAQSTMVARRLLIEELSEFRQAWSRASGRRVEQLSGPFLWMY